MKTFNTGTHNLSELQQMEGFSTDGTIIATAYNINRNKKGVDYWAAAKGGKYKNYKTTL